MKKIIITGRDSYIGNHIQNWLEQSDSEYTVKQVDVITDEWEYTDFAGTDAVIHVAGIVHRPDLTDWSIYEKVNVNLPVKIAQKAKAAGVRQFLFLSTMAVYGLGKRLAENIITEDTQPSPTGAYGKSKYLAEQKLFELDDEHFHVSVVRPPNVYGLGCKGNYISGFTSIAKKLPVIPSAYEHVKQSMIYIDNLTEFIRLLIDSGKSGVYMPQDDQPISAAQLMYLLAKGCGCNKKKSKLIGLGIYVLSFMPLVKKAYGGVAYSQTLSGYFENKYQVVSIEHALGRTVKNV